MAKRKWSDLSRTQQTAIAVVGVVEIAATTAMLVDLARRPASTVRGSKALWRGLSVVQPVGPLAYFTLGRIQQ
ncbi:PLDc N-terminal domain-containing protein [Mycolicibacterium austroafricanum]|uniref:PLDc N-terminal domain-containing protein n=1 Tax=Mycolicibacterium austroafricanum TaxID=39687 RepID=UPI001CA32765|nr:PLDc N-terminal domain-containing protein [Mycolicibacterium austroafricanum]QZT64818.1 PLDc N-terminal domain-containing protein [Mycolicibacterium austroafricanum]